MRWSGKAEEWNSVARRLGLAWNLPVGVVYVEDTGDVVRLRYGRKPYIQYRRGRGKKYGEAIRILAVLVSDRERRNSGWQ